jgi:hypothetical protein
MSDLSLAGKDDVDDRESIKKLAFAVNAAANGELGVALGCLSEARMLSLKEKISTDDDVYCCLSTAVHSFLADCLRENTLVKRKEKEDFVYFIQNVDSKAVKVGTTKDLPSRLGSLQTASCSRLMLLGHIKGGESTEKKIHDDLKKYSISGEWFEWSNFVKIYISKVLKDQHVQAIQYN